MERAQQIRLAKSILRWLIVALVAWGIWRASQKAVASIREEGFSLAEFDWWWLVISGLLYTLGLFHCWWFWVRTMRAMGQSSGWISSMFAYFFGHLGKYVPGKALVVVLRTANVKGPQVNAAVAALAVFVETLTMMAVGATLGGICLLFLEPPVWLYLATVGVILCAAIPTIPPVFRFVVKTLKVNKASQAVGPALDGIRLRLVGEGWLTIGLGWLLMAASLWAVLQSTPGVELRGSDGLKYFPVIMATVSLALVLGFVSLLPGGIGIRELVVFALVTQIPGVNDAKALAAAVMLRLVWLVAELLTSATLWAAKRLSPQPSPKQVA